MLWVFKFKYDFLLWNDLILYMSTVEETSQD